MAKVEIQRGFSYRKTGKPAITRAEGEGTIYNMDMQRLGNVVLVNTDDLPGDLSNNSGNQPSFNHELETKERANSGEPAKYIKISGPKKN